MVHQSEHVTEVFVGRKGAVRSRLARHSEKQNFGGDQDHGKTYVHIGFIEAVLPRCRRNERADYCAPRPLDGGSDIRAVSGLTRARMACYRAGPTGPRVLGSCEFLYTR